MCVIKKPPFEEALISGDPAGKELFPGRPCQQGLSRNIFIR
jgi:hypothetical protein